MRPIGGHRGSFIGRCRGAWFLLGLLAVPSLGDPYRIPDAELVNSEFGWLDGYGSSVSTLDGRTDVAGPGVLFRLTLREQTGHLDGKMGIGDPWPTNSAAALLYDPGVSGGCLPHYTSLAAYGSYQMVVSYLTGPAGSDIDVGLFLNTGLCGPSGYPNGPTHQGDPTNDTWWGSPWTTLALGETKTLVLDFNHAEAWNINDNTDPHTGGELHWANGGWYAIDDRDRHEISNIGIQVADFDGDTLGSQLGVQLNANPEPFSVAFAGSAFVCMVGWRLRAKAKRHRA